MRPIRSALRATALASLALVATSEISLAKKIVCIDGHDDPTSTTDLYFLRNHEGYERATAAPGDMIVVGGNLTDCLAMVGNGDTLVIVAHGLKFDDGMGNITYGFAWGGMDYTGFGSGKGEMAVPRGFSRLMNVTVRMCMCWSLRAGTGTSMVNDIKGEMGGAGNGHTVNGYQDTAWSEVCYLMVGGTAQQQMLAMQCLSADGSWKNAAPANRPNTGGPTQPPNQQTAAQAQVDARIGAGVVTIQIPNQVGMAAGPNNMPPAQPGYKTPTNVADQLASLGGCSCAGLPGCGFGPDGGIATAGPPVVPAMPSIALIAMAIALVGAGAWTLSRAQRETGSGQHVS